MAGATEKVGVVESGRVVHIKKDPYDVYIGRSGKGTRSKWGNPFGIGDPHPVTGEPITRGEAIPLFKEYAVRGAGRHLLKDLGELEGKILGCFCAPKGGVGAHDPLVCHGQILLLLLEHRRKKIAAKRKTGRKQIEFRRVPRERYIFFGSRSWTEATPIRERLATLPKDATIVVGGARGADKIAENIARRMGFDVEVWPARWDQFGKII